MLAGGLGGGWDGGGGLRKKKKGSEADFVDSVYLLRLGQDYVCTGVVNRHSATAVPARALSGRGLRGRVRGGGGEGGGEGGEIPVKRGGRS